MDPSLPSRISRYETVERLGQGGMGILYVARDPLLDRIVAIKVLSVHNAELRERFAREARSAASLTHQHIVTIYDVGEDQGQPFIAMEYVDGETLAEIIRRKAALSVDRKIQYLLELCSGLGYAHRSGIIHRDIKPANIMVTTSGVVKILDFGLARFADDGSQAGLTRAGMILGTLHYMSPEQIKGDPLDHRTDIFSTGLVLYELLCYRKAYTGDAPHTVTYRIVHSQPNPLREVYPSVDPELERIVNRAIAKSPDERYQNLADLAKDLSRVRDRLRETDQTVIVEREDPQRARAHPGESRRTPVPSVSAGRQFLNQDAMTRRRIAQIEYYLSAALQQYGNGQFQAAIDQCELAALLDPHEPRVLDLLHQAHRGLEDQRVEAWLNDAREHLSRGALTDAAALIDQSLQLRPDLADAQQLQRTLQDRRREQERARDRARAVRAAVERARFNLDEGALEAAMRSANEALALDPSNSSARDLKRQAAEAIDVRNREHELEQRALELVAAAREHAARQQFDRALEMLSGFQPSHPAIDAAHVEISAERAAEEQRRRDEDEARRRRAAEEEQRRREAERRMQELEAARRQQAEEEQRRRDADLRARAALAAERKVAARDALEQQRFDDALAALDQAEAAVPNDPDTRQLRSVIEESRVRHEEALERHRRVEQHLYDAVAARDAGDLMIALRHAEAATTLEPDNEAALELRAELRELLEARRRQDELRRAADATATRARRMFVKGDHDGAIRLLEEFTPSSLVAPVIDELRAELVTIVRAREAEEARAAAAAAEAEAARSAEAAARRRAEAEEEERARQQADEAQRRAEAAERDRRDAEARQQAEEEAERAAVAAARRHAEEVRAAAEARERARREANERQQAEEEAKRAAAETARRQAEEARAEAATRERARRAAEQQEQQRLARDEARRRAAEDAAGREAEEASRRAEERARREAESQATRRAEAEARLAKEQATGQADEAEQREAAQRARQQPKNRARPQAHAPTQGATAQDARWGQYLSSRRAAVGTAAAVVITIAAFLASQYRDPTDVTTTTTTTSPPPTLVTAAGDTVQDLLGLAREQYKRGDLQEAIATALSVLQREPGNANATELLHTVRSGAAARAASARNDADRQNAAAAPQYQDALRAMARAEKLREPAQAGEAVTAFEQAEKLFANAAATGFKNPNDFLKLAQNAGSRDIAVEHAQKGLQIDPAHRGLVAFVSRLRAQGTEAARQARQEAERAGASAETTKEFAEGNTFFRQGEALKGPADIKQALEAYDAAEERFKAAIVAAQRRRDGLFRAALERAGEQLRAGNLAEANTAVREALKYDPQNEQARQLSTTIQQRLDRDRQREDIAAILKGAAAERDLKERQALLVQGLKRYPNSEEIGAELERVSTELRGTSTPKPDPKPPLPSPAVDHAADVDKAFDAWIDASNRLDVEAALAVFPSNAQIRQVFGALREQQLQVLQRGRPVVQGNTATIECRIRYIGQPRNGTRYNQTVSQVIRFVKQNDRWVIVQTR